jgi:hypothetical protein
MEEAEAEPAVFEVQQQPILQRGSLREDERFDGAIADTERLAPEAHTSAAPAQLNVADVAVEVAPPLDVEFQNSPQARVDCSSGIGRAGKSRSIGKVEQHLQMLAETCSSARPQPGKQEALRRGGIRTQLPWAQHEAQLCKASEEAIAVAQRVGISLQRWQGAQPWGNLCTAGKRLQWKRSRREQPLCLLQRRWPHDEALERDGGVAQYAVQCKLPRPGIGERLQILCPEYAGQRKHCSGTEALHGAPLGTGATYSGESRIGAPWARRDCSAASRIATTARPA